MTFNDDSRLSGGKVRRRGRTTGIAVGGGALGVLVLAVLGSVLGVDLSGFNGLVGGGSEGGSSASSTELSCATGAEANTSVDCRLEGGAESLDRYWSSATPALGVSYTGPSGGVILFSDQTSTGCGAASAAVGPFYCPPDQTIYLDTDFFAELSSRFGGSSGNLAQLYILGHEWGHHIQNLTGAMDSADRSGTGPDSDSVRLELQADCYAGAWLGDASTVPDANGNTLLQAPTDQEVADALSAAAAVGDDRIQQSATGSVDPEGWTHGSAEQRQRWFTTGYTGEPASCDTFGVSAAAL